MQLINKLDMSMRVLETIDKAEEEKVKIIDNFNQICKKKSNIVQDDISTQKVNLQKRLAMRKSKLFCNLLGYIIVLFNLLNI